MGEQGGETRTAGDRLVVATHGQPVGEQAVSAFGEHRLGVELHTVQGQVAVLDEHGRGLGLGEVDAEGGLRPSRLFRWAAATGKVAAVGTD